MGNKKYHYVWAVYADNMMCSGLVGVYQFFWQAAHAFYRLTRTYGACVIRRKRQYWESKL